MKYSRLARKYAKVLLDLAVLQGETDTIRRDIAAMKGVITGLRPLPAYLSDSRISLEKRNESIEAAVKSIGASPLFGNFCRLLTERRRFVIFDEICTMYAYLADRRERILDIKVASAKPLSDADRARLESHLATKMNCKPRVAYSVLPELIAGLRVEADNVVYDNSVAARLEMMRSRVAKRV